MAGTIDDIIDAIKKGKDIYDKVKRAIDIVNNGPVSIGDRSKVEACVEEFKIGEREEEVAACAIKHFGFTKKYEVALERLGIETDRLKGEIIGNWSSDGCGIYDIRFTEKHSPNNSDWSVKLTYKIFELKEKKKGKCLCCSDGGVCVLVELEWEVERDITLWPDPSCIIKFSGIICAADGYLTPI